GSAAFAAGSTDRKATRPTMRKKFLMHPSKPNEFTTLVSATRVAPRACRSRRSAQRQRWVGAEFRRSEIFGQQARPGGGCDHCGVVGGERESGEGNAHAT